MVQSIDDKTETPSQTAGPYVHIGLMPDHAGNVGQFDHPVGLTPADPAAAGQRITITGQVLDGTGWALRDAVLESWQADAGGLYPGQPGADPDVSGFCRFATNAETGEFRLDTIKPGRAAGQAPHIALWIVARGINMGLLTRIYFDDEDNADDPVLAAIEQRHRVDTLIATAQGDDAYRFDIRLQGDGETVFFDM